MTLTPTLTITDEAIPQLNGLSHTLPPLNLSGIVGGLIGSALKGKELDATLAVTENGDTVTEQVTFNNTLPFIGSLLKPLTDSQTVAAEVVAILKDISPIAGLNSLKAEISFA